MSPVVAVVGLLTASIALYVAIAVLMRATEPVEIVPTWIQRGSLNGIARVLRPVEAAISRVRDRSEQDWTWRQYTAVALLLAFLSLMVLAIVGAGISVWVLL